MRARSRGEATESNSSDRDAWFADDSWERSRWQRMHWIVEYCWVRWVERQVLP